MKLTINLRHEQPTFVRVSLSDEEMIFLAGALPDADDCPYVSVEPEGNILRVRVVPKPKGARKGDIRKMAAIPHRTHPWLAIFNITRFQQLDLSRYYLGSNRGNSRETPDVPTEMVAQDGERHLVCVLDQAQAA